MLIALWAAVAALAAGFVVLLGAQVEQFNQLKQLRRLLDLEDRAVPVEIGEGVRGARAVTLGLPAELDSSSQSLVLFLSDKCATCHVIATSLRGGEMPPDTWLVVVPITGDGKTFVDKYELHGERVLIDAEHRVTTAVGLDVTPSALIVQDGRIADAHTIPSVRTFQDSLPSKHRKLLPILDSEDDLLDVPMPNPTR